MKEKFHEYLENIKKDLIFLSNQVEHNIHQSIKAFVTNDEKLAKKIIDDDKKIDRTEVEIEDKFLGLLAMQQPVAVDLRFTVGGLKMNNDLERIGDHAVTIARTVINIDAGKILETKDDIPALGEMACKMLHLAVNAFIHQDAELGRQVCKMDNEVDDFYDGFVKRTIEVCKKDRDKLDNGFHYVRIARSLERIADHSTNISEDVIFMKEAKIIRHHFQE
ncbi:MAG: phosphate signaling complex protein PhoU [Calditrichaceae bacterium]|nr:phosphate signaling complex protein PhoU [Calditrichaceae bacterium]MBN2710043.1 phosphate signaling complex protein PhoU [Calditrichaceae bacterium]RQV92142.1 MAG: phosphate signaling complex protein PhoU [Calditrichota bacterium]